MHGGSCVPCEKAKATGRVLKHTELHGQFGQDMEQCTWMLWKHKNKTGFVEWQYSCCVAGSIARRRGGSTLSNTSWVDLKNINDIGRNVLLGKRNRGRQARVRVTSSKHDNAATVGVGKTAEDAYVRESKYKVNKMYTRKLTRRIQEELLACWEESTL